MAESQTINPHLSGLLAPLRSEDDFELKVVGRIPDALAGAYYRNGPNPQFDPQGNYLSIFGDGMIHGFFLEPNKDGGRAHYRNRWVRTPRWLAENKAGRPLFGFAGAASDPSVAGVPPGTANTNIVHHAGRLMALQEQSEPFQLDPAGLERGAFLDTGGKFTAHPKLDLESGQMFWFAYWVGPQRLSNLIDYGVSDKTGTVTRRDRFAAPFASVIHDFMVTRNYVLFPILPLTGDSHRAARGLPPVAWEPAKGAFIGVMKRDAAVESIRWFEVEPSFVLHAMNVWEDGELIRCELMEYPNAPVFPNADGSPGRDAHARLTRWTIDLAGDTNRMMREQIDDLNSEMPRFDDRYAGRPYRHGWYLANVGDNNTPAFNTIAHIDLKTGKRALRILDAGDAADEPVFVPRSACAPEGDGYVIALVYRAASNTSELMILSAQDIAGEPVAVLKLPRRVPGGVSWEFCPGMRNMHGYVHMRRQCGPDFDELSRVAGQPLIVFQEERIRAQDFNAERSNMPQYASAFRDFGILPPGLLPPSEKIRSFFSTGRVIGQYIGTGIVSAIGLGLIVLIAMIVPTPLNLLGSAAVLMGFGAFIYLATHNDYRWVELEGTTLRAKHLYTGWIIERQVAEIESLRTMVYQIRRIETVVIEHLLGRVKGIEIRFRDGRTPLRILRADPAMTNARELIEAVVFRMGELREIDAEIVDFNGQPLARSVHWKGEAPRKATGQNLKLTLGCFMGIALLFGAILAFWGSGEQKLYVLGSVPPQEISVRSLIQNGLGANRHVTLTDFRPGGYSFETQSGPWTNVWIALFPSGAPAKEGDEIKVVISSNAVRDEPDLRRLLQHGRVTGICSPAPRSSWGASLGPELLKANPGCGLSSAWSIEELRELPSKEQINHLFAGSAACFVVVIAFALIIWSR